MYLKNITITNFKNYENETFYFSEGINCLIGKNGSGKTNVLDAVYFSCITKSAFQHKDNILLFPESDFYLIKAGFSADEQEIEVQASYQKKTRKVFKVNGRTYEKLSEHIGKFPIVMTTPYDTELIREGSEIRRKFFDEIICQFDKKYLTELVKYNSVLKTRNALLKHFQEQNYFDSDLLAIYDEQLFPVNTFLSEKRREFLVSFIPHFISHYNFLCDETSEEVTLTYKSNVTPAITEDFLTNRQKDRMLQRTSIGIHRDDFVFRLNNSSVKQIGSQGQQKSFILALQLAKFSTLHEKKERKPILLLDDIFDKLDENRIHRLIELMANKQFGQVFITDASKNRVQSFMQNTAMKIRLVAIENGQIKATEDV